MDFSDSGAAGFWRPGRGAVHHVFGSADPQARAGYVEQAAAAASRLWWIETWTNSPALVPDARVDLHDSDTADLVREARAVADARREAAQVGGIFGPGSGRPVLALILDLPDGLGVLLGEIYSLLLTARHMGISVTLVLPPLNLEVLGPAFRDLLAAGGVGHF